MCALFSVLVATWTASALTIDLDTSLSDDSQKVYLRVERIGTGCQECDLLYTGAGNLGVD